MKYLAHEPDPKHYAEDLRLDPRRGTLRWVSGRGQEVLIVRSAYGQGTEELLESLCAELSGTELKAGVFTELKSRLAVRHLTAMERVRENGCPADGAARTYTVFACLTEGDTRTVYAHRRQAVSTPRCDIPMNLRPGVEALTQERGFLRKTRVPTGCYRLTFPDACDSNYADGDLEYRAGDLTIPVTRRLFEAGEAYVNSPDTPVFVSRKKGIVLA